MSLYLAREENKRMKKSGLFPPVGSMQKDPTYLRILFFSLKVVLLFCHDQFLTTPLCMSAPSHPRNQNSNLFLILLDRYY